MDGLTGVRLDDCSPSTIDREVGSLVTHRSTAAGNTVVVLPDARYPFHASTGLVTNPAVVESICRSLRPTADAVVLFVAGSEHAGHGSVAEWLGYRRLAADMDVSLVTPPDCGSAAVTAHQGGERVSVSLPAPLVDHPVVNVPTLRRGTGTPVVGAGANLGRLAADTDDPAPATAAVAAVDPEFTVLDGTYVYAGRPHRARFLLAGADTAAIDRVGATLLGGDAVLARRDGRGATGTPRVEGVDISTLARELPDGRPSSAGDGLLERGYRLYARLSGDLLPPQVLEGERG